jgi:hypothetical protein
VPDHQSLTQRMHHLVNQWEQCSDNRWVFLSCYTMMTENMLTAIDAGGFIDGGWVERLLHHFAGYYFRSLEDFERGDEDIPAVWGLAHHAASRLNTGVMQNLLLGINAHINYDLVLTLVDLLEPDWERLSQGQIQQRYDDYCTVNDIIAETIDAVQDTVVERVKPDMDLIDRLFGPVDEWLASQLINAWRERVWRQALNMLESPNGGARERLRRAIEEATLQRSRSILLGV